VEEAIEERHQTVGRRSAGSAGESDVARKARIEAIVAQAEKSADWLTEHGQWDCDKWDCSKNRELMQVSTQAFRPCL
jgi:hypothetical protein